MKTAKRIFSGWFWAWLILAIVMVVGMLIVGTNNNVAVKGMAATIMATLMLDVQVHTLGN